MAESSAHILKLARRGAAERLRELAHEVKLLFDLFPDLHDAYDPDELPVSFILTRDGQAGSRTSARERKTGKGERKGFNRTVKQSWTERRAGSKS